MKRIKRFLLAVSLPLFILLLWFISTHFKFIDPLFLPKINSVADVLQSEFIEGELWEHLKVTVLRSFAGFILSAMIGVPLGLLIGRIRWLAQATQPTIDFFRSVPASALFPLFLFMFGVGDIAKIAVVIYAAGLIVLVNTAYGAMQVKKTYLLAAEVMGATKLQSFLKIIVPGSTPGIFAGLRIALSLSFVLIVVTEMFIGTNEGLGYYIINAQMVYRIPEMYAGIIITGFVGYAANIALLQIEKRVLHWVGK